jgi:hypothetical protein
MVAMSPSLLSVLMVEGVLERGVVKLALVAAALGCATRGEVDRPDAEGESADAAAPPDRALTPDARVERDLAAPDAATAIDAAADAADDAAAVEVSALRCNGHPALCDRRLDQVVFAATHNAMSSSADGWLAANQPHGIKRQLEDGIRALLIDTHVWRGGSYLCHSICELGNRPLVDGLRDIAAFLGSNPHEVLVLIIEDKVPAADTAAAFQQSGLIDLVYVRAGAWPTLRQMIASNRRLVVTAENGRPPPAWYHHLWDLAWDTPYSFKTTADFSCRQNRGSRASELFLLNHWLENPLPSEGQSATANAKDVLLGRARQCQSESGKLPNFVAVNHYSVGSLFEVVRTLNGL